MTVGRTTPLRGYSMTVGRTTPLRGYSMTVGRTTPLRGYSMTGAMRIRSSSVPSRARNVPRRPLEKMMNNDSTSSPHRLPEGWEWKKLGELV